MDKKKKLRCSSAGCDDKPVVWIDNWGWAGDGHSYMFCEKHRQEFKRDIK